MKKRILSMFLLVLMGVAGNMTAWAQVPEPSGQWKFDDTSDLMAATVGNVTLSPAVLGSSSVSPATVSEAGITVAEGPNGSSAIFVPAASALKVERAEGAAASMSFSFMIDLKVPNAYVYDGLFQTSTGNTNDGEVFISKSQIGANAMGGYVGCIWNDTWYRVVFTNDGGKLKLYVNGVKLTEYETDNTRWEIDPVFYLLADEDGEVSDTYVSEVAFWETPLTDDEAIALGSLDNSPWITDAGQIKEGDQFFIISDRGRFNGTKTAKPKAMSTYQSSYTTSNWGDQYVYWGDLDKEADGFVWTAEKVGDQWAFLNKENGKYIGNMNTSPEEADVVFSDTPVGYTLTDLAEGAGRFYMTNDESEHSLHVQGYLRGDRASNSLAKQNVGDDDYETANASQNGYPGRWKFLKLNADEPVDPRTQIGSAEDFKAFAEAVNAGQTDIDAVLTADIDLTAYASPVMPGTSSTVAYSGTFDGQGHTITYAYTTVDSHSGLFGYINGATIRNLRVEGSAVVQGIHFGALFGHSLGEVLIENVVTNVDITGDRSGVTGDGGMTGYNEGTVTFNNCATLGTMGSAGTSMYCGFVAFASGTSILNNCYTTASLTEDASTQYCYTFCRGTATYNNCYYLNAIGTEDGGTQITEDMLASGELCYKLNGDQSTIGWYQTIGTDALPVPFATSEQVYANGELKCDGTAVEGGTLTYSNSATSVVPPHTFEGGWCTVCGGWDASYQLSVDDEGFNLIANARELAWFAEYVAQGNPCGNVKLTADIDLGTSNWPDMMIATQANPFTGIFDGQEHTITINYENVISSHQGLFRTVKNATIRNLRVEGSVVSKNVHFGALMGRAEGTVLVENVVTDVDITGQMSQVTGDAGMVGANYAQLTFNNCATLGEMGYAGSSMYSSYCGWADGNSSTTLNNCYTTCSLTEGTSIGNCFTLTHSNGTNTFNNCYYLNEIRIVQGTAITEDQLTSGELCYKLNGDQSAINWYQTLDTDGCPVPFASHAQVYATGEVRCDGAPLPDSPITYSNTEGQTTRPDHQYDADGICTVCGSPTQNAEGYYLIDTAKKLNWLATKTSEGTTNLNALLTADINLSTSDYPDLMIGTETAEYAGIFDGDGHTITYHYALVADKWRGLFAFVNGATIRNLYVEGSAIATNIHYGALIGRAYGTVLVENVITNVDITGQRTDVTGDGGMLGANYANITFNNCATLGEMGNPGSEMYSSFSGWSNGSSSTTLNSCYSLCEKTEGTGDGNCFTLTHKGGTVVINNSYYLNLIGTYVGGTQIAEEEVANGSLCVKLGNGWYQTIGEDAYPIFDKTHGIVKEVTEAGYATMYIGQAVNAPEGVSANTGKIEGEASDQILRLYPIEGTVPAWEPVVLSGAPGFYSFTPVDTDPVVQTDVLTWQGLGLVGTNNNYNEFAGATFNSSAEYAGLASSGTGQYIQLRTKNSNEGIITTASGGNLKSVTIAFNAKTTDRVLNIYGKNEPYEAASDLFDSEKQGDLIASIAANGETFTAIPKAEYKYVGMASSNAALYIDQITVEWEEGGLVIPNIADNELKGTADDMTADGSQYVLAMPEGAQVGFYKAIVGSTISAGKAYLEPENALGIKAFLFGGDDATSIANVEKTIETGAIYNLAGQRLQKMQKGINIINGKKVLVK